MISVSGKKWIERKVNKNIKYGKKVSWSDIDK